MQPPKEQHLKYAEIDSETPLLVLRYTPLNVCKSFVLSVISMGIYKYFFFDRFINIIERIDFFLFFLTSGFFVTAIGLLFLVYLIVVTIDILFMESFELYENRVEKCYGVLGKKILRRVLYLREAYILIKDKPSYKIRIILKADHVGSSFKKLTYYASLGHNKSLILSSFIDCCEYLGVEFLKTENFVMEKGYYEATEGGFRKRDFSVY